MESIPKNEILEYNTDTLQFIRKQYDLDKPERLEQAIAIIQHWLNKQEHIVKKTYSKEYLERLIINCKGSLEKVKGKLDKIAILRTLSPHFFEPILDPKNSPLEGETQNVLLPKLTKDHHRILFLKDTNKKYEAGIFIYFRYFIMLCEYIQTYDYCNGIILVLDYRDTNIFGLLKLLNIVELKQLITIVESFGMRMHSTHFITTSKAIDTMISMMKQAVSKKYTERFYVHKNFEELHAVIPKELLPSDYGGMGKTLNEYSDDCKAALGSDHFINHLKEMQKAGTNENYRRDDKFSDEYLGIAGSFRSLNVD